MKKDNPGFTHFVIVGPQLVDSGHPSAKDLGMVIKKMVGHPRGIPVGSGGSCPTPENPGEPLKPGESLEKTAAEKLSQALDLAEHAACQLELD